MICRILARASDKFGASGEALDGHSELPMDCLAEPMCEMRAGESGSSFGIAPNEANALATALAIRPPIGMIALAGALDAKRIAR
jgi:hypothetical protein